MEDGLPDVVSGARPVLPLGMCVMRMSLSFVFLEANNNLYYCYTCLKVEMNRLKKNRVKQVLGEGIKPLKGKKIVEIVEIGIASGRTKRCKLELC